MQPVDLMTAEGCCEGATAEKNSPQLNLLLVLLLALDEGSLLKEGPLRVSGKGDVEDLVVVAAVVLFLQK